MEHVKTIDRLPRGKVTPPPSKSLSHRALICSGLADGMSFLENLSDEGDDVAATIFCLSALGIDVTMKKSGAWVQGIGPHPVKSLGEESLPILDCGESGSTLRFLIPLLLLKECPAILTGHGRLMERPMSSFLTVLEEHGARIKRGEGTLTIQGKLNPGRYSLPGNVSSQFVTGLLLTLPLLSGDSEIILTSPLESKAYVDMTLSVMEVFGVRVGSAGDSIYKIRGNQSYQPVDYTIEGDFSGAAFFLVASALGCKTGCGGLKRNSLQGDRQILDVLEACGSVIEETEERGLFARADKIKPLTLDIREIPDLAPPVAALLCFAQGTSRIENAARLRMKESDRLQSLTEQLSNLGASIREGVDYLEIHGKEWLTGGFVDPQKDHRIAMAAAVAAIGCRGPVTISDPDCVNKSYPNFWVDFCKEERRGRE